jgi:4-hydroxy-2-oxoheptanedioate aldolase
MKLPQNPFMQALADNQQQIGLWVSLANGYAAEAVASAGYDWLLVDMEHAPSDLQTVLNQLQAIAQHGSTAIVRPPWNEPVIVKRLLDMGARGLLFPMVQSVAEAEAAVAATRYPPRGVRGVAGTTRANHFGRITDYYHQIENETAVLIQLESVAAVENALEIGTVEGVTGVFFGPADIGADMGLVGNPMHPAIWDIIKPAAAKLIAKGIPVGTLVSDPSFAAALLRDGFTFVACGSDAGLLARGADTLLATMRKNLDT